MPRESRVQSPKKLRPMARGEETRETRAAKRRKRDTRTEHSTHPMVTRSRSHDEDRRIVFTQLTYDPPKKQRKQLVEKKKTIKAATKTSEKRKENVIISNEAHQSSDEEDAPEEHPPKAKEGATFKGPQRSLFSPVSHISSPMLRHRPETRQLPGKRPPETSTVPQVPGPSNAPIPLRRDDAIGGLERSPSFFIELLKDRRIEATKKTTETSEGKGGKLTVSIDQQSSNKHYELNTLTLQVPPRSPLSPVHHSSSAIPRNRPEHRRSPQMQIPGISAAPQVSGLSNSPASVSTDDERGELEGAGRFFLELPKNQRIPIYSREKQKKITRPVTKTSDNRRDARGEPNNHHQSSEDYAAMMPGPSAKKTAALQLPVRQSIILPIRRMSPPMPHDRPEFRQSPLIRSLETPTAVELLAPSITPFNDSVEITDEVEKQPREAAEAPDDNAAGPSGIASSKPVDNSEEVILIQGNQNEKNLPLVEKDTDFSNLRSQEEIIEMSSSFDSSPDVSHHSRSMLNITVRKRQSLLMSVSDAVLLPHATDNWTQIEIGFAYRCTTIKDLKKSMAVYNNSAANGEFRGLNYVLSRMFAPEMNSKFYCEFRKRVTSLALQLPILMSETSIPILKCNESLTLQFSRGQIACILANAFFCTFPEDSKGAAVNFSQLFETFEDDADSKLNQIIGEKLKCIMEYFWNINENADDLVTFRRLQLTSREQLSWEMMTNKAQNIDVTRELQESHKNCVLIIFTNDSIGGGIFGFDAGTEEICFLTHPELLVLRLFAEPLEDNEAFLVSGAHQFCRSQGSADSFRYAPAIGRTSRNIIVMKWKGFNWPQHFTFNFKEFTQEVNRIDSALDGIPPEILEKMEIIVGGLAGDEYHEIQFLLMIMIASKYERRLIFFTHDNEVKRENLLFIQKIQPEGNVDATKIYKALRQYNDKYSEVEKKPHLCFWLKVELKIKP